MGDRGDEGRLDLSREGCFGAAMHGRDGDEGARTGTRRATRGNKVRPNMAATETKGAKRRVEKGEIENKLGKNLDIRGEKCIFAAYNWAVHIMRGSHYYI